MIPELYEHQKRIIEEGKKKCGLFIGTGGAKTRTALEMAEGSVLVICPKQQREDKTWESNAEKFGIVVNIKVVSKEDIRRDWEKLPAFDTVIIDECHTVLGVTSDTKTRNKTQVPKTSQIFEAVYSYLKKSPPRRLYLCSATPVGKPMNLWAIAKLLGFNWDYFGFRQKYYFEIRMGQRRIWLPKKDKETKDEMARLVKEFGYTGALSEFTDVPAQTDKTVYIDLSEEQKAALKKIALEEADPLVRRSRGRTVENGVLYGKRVESNGNTDTMVNKTTIFKSHKIDYILERALEFPKLLIFANYTAQIETIKKELLSEGYTVHTLTGSTKDRSFIKEVNESDKPCIVVAQSSVSAGWELPSFPCVVFASLSWKVVDHIQAKGRVLRMNKLKKNLYIYLVIKGGVDEDCYKAIMDGNDFIEKMNTN